MQPLVETPFTNIQGDSTGKNKTHPGTDYAALLVNRGYDPPSSPEDLPASSKVEAPTLSRQKSFTSADMTGSCALRPVFVAGRERPSV